eukprot:485202-Heterocapsa_arctica.AAC.1
MAYLLEGLGLDTICDINSLVCAYRRPAPGRCHRRPHWHVDTPSQCRLSVSTLPVVRASVHDSIDKRHRSCPRPWVRTPTVCPALL